MFLMGWFNHHLDYTFYLEKKPKWQNHLKSLKGSRRLDDVPRGGKPGFPLQIRSGEVTVSDLFGDGEFTFFRKVENVTWENTRNLLSRELTYPTLGNGKSSSKVIFDGICWFPEG